MMRLIPTPEFKKAVRDWLYQPYRLSAIVRLGGRRMVANIESAVDRCPCDENKIRSIAIVIAFEGEVFLDPR